MYDVVTGVFVEVMPIMMMGQPLTMAQMQMVMDASDFVYVRMGRVAVLFGINMFIAVGEMQKFIYTWVLGKKFSLTPLFWCNCLCIASYVWYLHKFFELRNQENMGFGMMMPPSKELMFMQAM